MSSENHRKDRYFFKRTVNESSKVALKRQLRAFLGFSQWFRQSQRQTQIYGYFSKTKFIIKSNKKANPWVTKEIAKPSKCKEKLYEKFLKNCYIQNGKIYEDYWKLFEIIRIKPRHIYYTKKLQFEGDTKNMANYKITHSLNLTTPNCYK